MLRADNIICGTSTTGTGTLTLVATPVPPGGIDFDVFARATGVGLPNSAAILVSYTIIEYTSSAFSTMKSHEKGIGTLTLNSSTGIASCTLARTTVQTTATSLDSQPATQNIGGAGFSIATAANTLVFIGVSAADTMGAIEPYGDTTGTNLGFGPLCTALPQNADGGSIFSTSGTEYFQPFLWATPLLVKSCRIMPKTTYSGTTNFYARIYSVGSNGKPNRLLIDFGVLGTANTSFTTGGVTIASAAHANGYFLTPGVYFMSFLHIFSGGAGSPNAYAGTGPIAPYTLGVDGGNLNNGMGPFYMASATSGNATGPATANNTGYACPASGSNGPTGFSLRGS